MLNTELKNVGAIYEINGEVHPWPKEIAGFQIDNSLGPDDYLQKAFYYHEDTGIFTEVEARDSNPPKFVVHKDGQQIEHGGIKAAMAELPAAVELFEKNGASLRAYMGKIAKQHGWDYTWIPGDIYMSFSKKIDKYGDSWVQVNVEDAMDLFKGQHVKALVRKGTDQAYLGNSYSPEKQFTLESKDQILDVLNKAWGLYVDNTPTETSARSLDAGKVVEWREGNGSESMPSTNRPPKL